MQDVKYCCLSISRPKICARGDVCILDVGTMCLLYLLLLDLCLSRRSIGMQIILRDASVANLKRSKLNILTPISLFFSEFLRMFTWARLSLRLPKVFGVQAYQTRFTQFQAILSSLRFEKMLTLTLNDSKYGRMNFVYSNPFGSNSGSKEINLDVT